ncbi:MAG TPA: MBL fold metallo-hydrolase [Acidimicrobiales bacterium]
MTAAPPTRPHRQEAEPASDEVTEVAPGVLRLQLPIPLPGLRHVNCYALEDERGWAVVDPGMPGPWFWRALEQRFRTAGFRTRNVHTVVLTHSHPDHFGGAGRIRQVAGAEVVSSASFRLWWDPDTSDDTSPDDADEQPVLEPEPRSGAERRTPWGTVRPMPPKRIRMALGMLGPLRKRLFPTPRPTRRLNDAATIQLGRREWVAVHTPGHTPDHLCLFDPEGGTLLAGDHVLPTITPHVSGLDSGDDPLGTFMASLDKVAGLDGAQTILPAHGHPFTGLIDRVDDIKRHHDDRLDRLRTHLAEMGEATVTELSHQLFRPRSWGGLAESETYAHLEHLRLGGTVTRRDDSGSRRIVYALKNDGQ